MHIELRLFASLRKYNIATEANTISLPEGSSVHDLFARLSLNTNEVKIIMVNGIHRDQDYALHDGDRVGLFPPVGGG